MKSVLKISIAFASDDSYAQHLGCVVASILANARRDESFVFYVLDSGISEENKEKLRSLLRYSSAEMVFLPVDLNLFQHLPDLAHFSLNTYSRLLLPELLPHVDRILYLDCDMIVTTSLAGLWNTDLGNCSLGAVPDYPEWYSQPDDIHSHLSLQSPVFNAGMLLLNLKQIREKNLFVEVLEWIQKNDRIQYPDQDGLNVIFENDRLLLPLKWNLQTLSSKDTIFEKMKEEFLQCMKNPVGIIHFIAGHKPWQAGYEGACRKYYWKYLRKTPWKEYRVPNSSWINDVRKFLRRNRLNQKFRKFQKDIKNYFVRKKHGT